MISLARFILKGYSQAALVAASMAMLGLLMPPVAWFSGAAVALVTLVNGHRSGLLVTAIAGIGTAVFAGLIMSLPEVAIYYVLLVWLPLVIVAVVLRQTVSLVLCLQLIAGVSLLGIVILYMLFPDFGEIWRSSLNTMAEELIAQSEGSLDAQQLQLVIDRIVRLLPGFFASSFMIGTLVSLYLARWWQAVIYNPGGFGKEFRALNLGKATALAALAIAVAASFGSADIFNAMLLVVFALYLNQGVAVLHAVFAGRQLNAVWLFLVYLIMFFVPHTVVLLALAGLVRRLERPAPHRNAPRPDVALPVVGIVDVLAWRATTKSRFSLTRFAGQGEAGSLAPWGVFGCIYHDSILPTEVGSQRGSMPGRPPFGNSGTLM